MARFNEQTENAFEHYPLLPWLIFLLGLLSFYGGTLSFGFTYDDVLLIRPYTWDELFSQFSSPWGGHFYRPVINFIFAAEFALFGHHAWLYHSVNLLLASLLLFLFYIIMRHFKTSPIYAILSGLVWMLLPGNAVLCSWISTRTDIVCLLFYLLAVLSFILALEMEKPRVIFHLVAYVSASLAYLSKETAVTLPLLLTWICFYYFRRDCRRLLPILVFHWVLLLGYLVLRWQVLGASIIGTKGLSQEAVVAQSFFLSAIGMLARYVEAVVSCFYPIFLMPNLFSALMLLVAIIVFIYTIRGQQWPRGTIFWLGWIFITALTNLFDASPRLLGLPTLGAAFLIVHILSQSLSDGKAKVIKLTLLSLIYLLTMAEVNGMVQNCFTQITYQSTLQYDIADRRRWPFSDLGQMRYKLRKNLLQILEKNNR